MWCQVKHVHCKRNLNLGLQQGEDGCRRFFFFFKVPSSSRIMRSMNLLTLNVTIWIVCIYKNTAIYFMCKFCFPFKKKNIFLIWEYFHGFVNKLSQVMNIWVKHGHHLPLLVTNTYSLLYLSPKERCFSEFTLIWHSSCSHGTEFYVQELFISFSTYKYTKLVQAFWRYHEVHATYVRQLWSINSCTVCLNA